VPAISIQAAAAIRHRRCPTQSHAAAAHGRQHHPGHDRCGPLSEATTAQIQALPVDQLEALADALLDFQGLTDLTSWLAANS
jgi:hypothetical protein